MTYGNQTWSAYVSRKAELTKVFDLYLCFLILLANENINISTSKKFYLTRIFRQQVDY